MENLRTYEEFDKYNLKKIEKRIKIYEFIYNIKNLKNFFGTEFNWRLNQLKWIRIIFKFLNREDISSKLDEIEQNRNIDEIVDKNINYIQSEFKKEIRYPFDLKNEIKIQIQYNLIDKKNLENFIRVISFLSKTKISEIDPYGEEDWDD
jgi:hypothetical protein